MQILLLLEAFLLGLSPVRRRGRPTGVAGGWLGERRGEKGVAGSPLPETWPLLAFLDPLQKRGAEGDVAKEKKTDASKDRERPKIPNQNLTSSTRCHSSLHLLVLVLLHVDDRSSLGSNEGFAPFGIGSLVPAVVEGRGKGEVSLK